MSTVHWMNRRYVYCGEFVYRGTMKREDTLTGVSADTKLQNVNIEQLRYVSIEKYIRFVYSRYLKLWKNPMYCSHDRQSRLIYDVCDVHYGCMLCSQDIIWCMLQQIPTFHKVYDICYLKTQSCLMHSWPPEQVNIRCMLCKYISQCDMLHSQY